MDLPALKPSVLPANAPSTAPTEMREAARQFEGLFTSMLLKSMRDATPKSDLFGSDQQAFYQDMFDQQLAMHLAAGQGIGLAEQLVQQLMRAPGSASAGAPAPGSREAFIAAVRPAAEKAAARLGVDADAIVAQAALETGWGRAVPRNADGSSSHNLFGIKASGSWNGASAEAGTREYVEGVARNGRARFRSYDSLEASVQDYAQLLAGRDRYAAVRNTGADIRAFAEGLQAGGYATDPAYADKLVAVAQRLKSGAMPPLTPQGAV
ncbi:MAG: hypothetical protein RL026_2167 [Pseudomonadota bacterium]|jgi:flagellar protein FlgJ